MIETGSYSGRWREQDVHAFESGPYTERDETWALGGDGTLRITVTQRASGVDAKSTTLTYRRRQ